MNKFVILFLTSLTFSYSLKAQCTDTKKNDIFTPNGKPVDTWVMCEDPLDVRAGFDRDYSRSYPNAKPIITYDNLSSTAKFNCHGYAWLRVEGGPDRWIGHEYAEMGKYPDIYMTDGSYVEVPAGTHPAKVFWERPKDHSAITTSHPDTVISKWNRWPLMKHYWSDSPFKGGTLHYYVRPTITGSKNICVGSSYTFSVTNAPNGFVWDVSSNLTKIGADTSIIVIANGNKSPGWVRIMLGSIELARYDLWVGLPSPYIYFNVQGPFYSEDKYVYDYIETYAGDLITLYPQYPKYVGALGFEIANNTGPTIKLFSPDDLSFKTLGSIGYTFSFDFRYKNACGWSDWWTITVVNTKYYDSRASENGNGWIAYPNPTSSILNIEIKEVAAAKDMQAASNTLTTADALQSKAIDPHYDIRLYDSFGILQRQTTGKDSKVSFNVANLPNGFYYLHIYDGVHEKPEIRQIIVSHK